MQKSKFRLLAFLLLGLLWAIPASAQGNTVTIPFNGVPSGTCAFIMLGYDMSSGDLYKCGSAGTWVLISAGGAAPVPSTRTISTTSPITIDGTTSANLSANRTIACATCEVTTAKDAANGYAGLDGSTKVAVAELSEVMALSNLSDVTAKTGTGTEVPGMTTANLGDGDYLAWSSSGYFQNRISGISFNAQTGTTDTIAADDRGKIITYSNTAPVAVTLPVASTTGFGAAWFTYVKNIGVGLITITPTTSTINGATTMVLAKGAGALIVGDGTNYTAIIAMSLAVCVIDNDMQSATVLADANITGRCTVPFDSTLIQVSVIASGGTPTILLERFRPTGASSADLQSGTLATAASGAIACAMAATTQACIGGTTSSGTVSLSNTSLLAGDIIRVKSATAGGVATWHNITAFYSRNN